MAGSDDEVTPPGWYRQTEDPERLRWWDGDDWTDDTMPVPAPAESRAAGPKVAKKVAKTAATKAAPSPAPTEPRRTRRDAMAEAEAEARGDVEAPALEILLEPEVPREPKVTREPKVPREPAVVVDPAPGPGPVTQANRSVFAPEPSAGPAAEPRTLPSRHGVRPQPRPSGGPGPQPRPQPRPATRGPRSRGERLAEPSPAAAAALLRILVRAGIIAVVLGIGWVAFTKVRDAEPNHARTLTEDARTATVDSDAPRLDQIVLTLADLPRGWSSAQTADVLADAICEGRSPRSVIKPTDIKSAVFTMGETGTFIGNVVQEFIDDDTAQAFMDLTARTADACREYTNGDSTVHLTPMSFPSFGDESFVAQLGGESPSGAVDGAVVYVRTGTRVVSVVSIGVGGNKVDTTLIEHLTQLEAHRMGTKPKITTDITDPAGDGGQLPGG